MQVGDFGEVLNNDDVHTLYLLDAPTPPDPPPKCFFFSTQAVAGMETPHIIRLRAPVGNQVLLLLVYSGSTHSFISMASAECIKANTISMPAVDMRVVNGERMVCNSMVPWVQWLIQGHTFTTNMR